MQSRVFQPSKIHQRVQKESSCGGLRVEKMRVATDALGKEGQTLKGWRDGQVIERIDNDAQVAQMLLLHIKRRIFVTTKDGFPSMSTGEQPALSCRIVGQYIGERGERIGKALLCSSELLLLS